MEDKQVFEEHPPVSVGVPGVDDILRGGLSPDCLYLLSGTPGTGKTTLALQFLLCGVRAGESCLYVTLSESRREIAKVARSHGWDLSGLEICELVPSEHNLSVDSQLTVFNPSELELGETTQAMIAAVKQRTNRGGWCSIRCLNFGLVAQNSLRYPPADPGAETILWRDSRLHCADA